MIRPRLTDNPVDDGTDGVGEVPCDVGTSKSKSSDLPSQEQLIALGHHPEPAMSVMRKKCLDCAHTAHEVRNCTVVSCQLWPYRFGKNPFRKRRTLSAKHRAALRHSHK
jgi:hypothetical protein